MCKAKSFRLHAVVLGSSKRWKSLLACRASPRTLTFIQFSVLIL